MPLRLSGRTSADQALPRGGIGRCLVPQNQSDSPERPSPKGNGRPGGGVAGGLVPEKNRAGG